MKIGMLNFFQSNPEKKAARQNKKQIEEKSTHTPQDALNINTPQTKQGKANIPLFSAEETGTAREFLNQFSQGAFEPVRTTSDRLINLKTSHDTIDQANPESYGSEQHWETIDGQLTTGRIELNDLNGIDNFESLKSEFENSLSHHHATIAALGENPSQAELEKYINDNYLAIAQVLGNHLDSYYEGFVQVNGNVNSFDSLNERGGVCSDIHAAITAFHTIYGKESYVMMSSGNDFAHVISLFKDDGKWFIHNYDNIVETDAQTIEELYDIVMPENRSIKLWSVDENGNLEQVSTDHLTATGRAERRFRAEAGVGNFNPWIAEEGITIGTESVSINKDGLYAEINHAEISAALGYYQQDLNGSQRSIRGFAFEGQYDTNSNGYKRRHIDGKYENEKRWVTENNYGREHFSVHSGIEGSTQSPAYWGNDERDPIGQLGVTYARNQSRVYGESALKAELGYQAVASGTLSASLDDPTNFQTAGLMYSDLNVEGKVVTGLFYQPNQNITVRTGLASGVDLDNIDGTHIGEQLGNIAESEAYLDLRFGHGVVAGNILGEIPIHNPTQYKVGAGIAIAPLNNNKVVVAATYLQERIVTDTIDKVRIGAEIRPHKQVALGANISTPIMGDNTHDLTASGYLKVVGF